MSDFDAWLQFRAGENPAPIRLKCTECGGPAEGNCSWVDGSGEICDACVKADEDFEPMDRIDLGYAMMQWHSSSSDPIYMVGSLYSNDQVYPEREIVESALATLENDLNNSRRMLRNETVSVRRNGKMVSLRSFAGYTDDDLKQLIDEQYQIVGSLYDRIREDYDS